MSVSKMTRRGCEGGGRPADGRHLGEAGRRIGPGGVRGPMAAGQARDLQMTQMTAWRSRTSAWLPLLAGYGRRAEVVAVLLSTAPRLRIDSDTDGIILPIGS